MKRIGYMDKTDFDYEVGEARGGNNIYPSMQDTKRCQPCSENCGIVKVEVKYLETVHPEGYDRGKSAKEWEDYEKSAEYRKHLENKLKIVKSHVEYYEKKLKDLEG